MHLTMQERHLREVEAHIARGDRHIARQREIIAELEGDGHDTTAARRLLETVETARRLRMAERERLQRTLQYA